VESMKWLPGVGGIGYAEWVGTRRVTRFLMAVVRWGVRQLAMSLVVVAGVVIGWWGRKATGPELISEQVQAAPVARAVGRPPPVVPVDPVARSWLEEATRLSSPSASLLALRELIEAGEISDFGRLARSLVCHPLPVFRAEALTMLIPAWGRTEPAEALAFIQANMHDLGKGVRRPESFIHHYYQIAHSWTVQDPMAAMRFLSPERCRSMGLDWKSMVGSAVHKPGDASQPGYIDRLKMVAELYGEPALSSILVAGNGDAWQSAGRLPTADDWRALADTLTNNDVRGRILTQAFFAWRDAAGTAVDMEKARAWFGGPLPIAVETQVAMASPNPRDLADLLRSESSAGLPLQLQRVLLGQLQRRDPELALDLMRTGAVHPVIDPSGLVSHLGAGGERALQDWLAVLPTSGQREEVLRHWFEGTNHPATPDAMATTVAQALSFGPDGEAATVALMGRRAGTITQAVPEIFGGLPPETQARMRMDLVLELGRHTPDVAAELWMDATPAELERPGAAAVAEGIAGQLLRRDPEVGSAWIAQLPPGESRDRAVARMIELMAAEDPGTSAEWATTLVDPESQNRARQALEVKPRHRLAQ